MKTSIQVGKFIRTAKENRVIVLGKEKRYDQENKLVSK